MSDTKLASEGKPDLSPLQKSALVIKKLRGQIAKADYAKREPIAIVGMGCRFPEADGLEAYWHLLSEAKDAIREVPKERWDLTDFFDTNPNAPGKINTRYGSFINHVDEFDASFFGISPHEAERIDPQQRILLEVAWHALEDAGIPPSELRGSRTGVFVGMTQMDYGVMQLGGDLDEIDGYTGTGTGFCFAAGRLSYLLGLQGPTFSVDTACSSSMVALHQASQALRNGECDVALVAGAQLNLTPSMQVFLSKTQSFSADGRCRTFDEAANGFVLGEGVGVIVLRRLSDAQNSDDQIRAVVRASGVNHDGPASGLTVPNEKAQVELIREVYQHAGLNPADIDYIEAHGTATELGDPIEVGALRSVFGQRETGQQDDLWLGSVKTNFGHLNAAAGMAGLIKVVLMLEHEQIAPNLHFKKPSSRISWDGFSVRVPTQLEPWEKTENYRRAGVSSFGLSGTNTHTVLEDIPHKENEKTEATIATIATIAQRPLHLLCLSARTEASLLQSAKNMLNCTAMSDDTSLANICYSANSGRDHFACRLTVVAESKDNLRQQLQSFIANETKEGLKTGVHSKGGSGRLAMLFTDEIPVTEIYRLAHTQPGIAANLHRYQIIADKVKPGLLAVEELVVDEDNDVAKFAAQLAMAELWISWGMKPAAVSGCGVGELTALCLAGVLDHEQAFQLLAGHAVDTHKASIAVYSGVDGNLLPYVSLTDYRYPSSGQSNLATAAKGLDNAGFKTVLAVGEEETSTNTTEIIGLFADNALWPSLLNTLSELYLRGFSIDWKAYDADYSRQKVRLPGYAFQRQSYWTGTVQQAQVKENNSVLAPDTKDDEQETIAEVANTPSTVSIEQEPAENVATQNISQLLEEQLALASNAINDVVDQQLAFLKQRVKSNPIQSTVQEKVQETVPNNSESVTTDLSSEDTQAETKSQARHQPRHQLGDWYLLLMAAENKQASEELLDKVANSITDKMTSIIGLDGMIGDGNARTMLVHQGNDDAALALGKIGKEGKVDEEGKARKPDFKRLISSTAQPKRDVVFMFPGVGDHYLNMAQGLYAHEPVFRATVDRCCDYLKSSLSLDLLSVIYPVADTAKESSTEKSSTVQNKKMDFRAMLGRGGASADPATEKLNQTLHSQPLVFIIEYALGKLWLSRGVQPQAMIGYSIGEYAAACLAGVIDLEDVLILITERAKMIQTIPAGVMLAVPLSEAKLLPLLNKQKLNKEMLNKQLSLAIVSTPSLCVVGGDEENIIQLEARLKEDEVVSRRLPGTHAFHSHMLEPLHESLVELIKGFSLHAPKIPYISNLTGNWITEKEATDPAYWANHTWQTVRFAGGLAKLLDTEGRVFLEVGPGQSLGSFVLQHPAAQQLQDKIVLPSLKNRYEKQADEAFLLGTLGKLWLAGIG